MVLAIPLQVFISFFVLVFFAAVAVGALKGTSGDVIPSPHGAHLVSSHGKPPGGHSLVGYDRADQAGSFAGSSGAELGGAGSTDESCEVAVSRVLIMLAAFRGANPQYVRQACAVVFGHGFPLERPPRG